MNQRFDTILKSGTVVNQDGEGIRDIGISNGRIAAIGGLGQAQAGETIDCKGLHILPGVMDTQVHFREPGQTHKEDLETGSRSAVMGGVTAVFEMPNTDPLTVTEQTFTDKVKRGRHRMHCDFAFFIGGTRENVAELPELERAPGCAGVKVFIGSSTGALLVEDDESLRRIFQVIRRRAAFMPDEYRLNGRKPLRVRRPALASGVAGRDRGAEGDPAAGQSRETENASTCCTSRPSKSVSARPQGRRVLRACRITDAGRAGMLQRLGTRAQMNPPVADHREGIWHGIEGVSSTCSAPTTRRIRAGGKAKTYRLRPRA
jgi:dihydroorotase